MAPLRFPPPRACPVWVAEASVVRVQHQRARYKRMRSALVLAAVLQMLIMLSMTPSFLAQPVAMGNGSEGCLQKVPSAPTNVQAKVKDGAVLLSWSPPEDGACVATYIVDVYDPGLRSSGPVQSASTDGHSLSLDGLQNGKLYQFRVQAFNAFTGGTGVANIQATPTDLCLNQPPGKPTNLRVTPAKGMAQLCWSGVENNACVDQYRVSAVKTAEANFRSGFGSLPVSKGGCANISSLTDGVQYTFSVVAVSNANGQSPAASTTAFVGSAVAAQNGWKCNPMPGCRPNSVSMCSLLGCQGTANMGGCKGPGMYDLSYLDKKVTQWCSQACACDTSVSAVFSPLSWGISTGIMNGVNSLLGMNPAPSPVMTQSSSQLSAALSNGLKNGVNSLLGQAADSTRAAPGLPQGLIAGLLAGNGVERAGGVEGGPMLGAGLVTAGAHVLQNVAASGVVGNMLGQTMGELTTSVVSGLVNTVVEGVVGRATSG
ncbi:fibronectin type III [Haematococcus lacustris]